MKYYIENNINFYAELYKSLDDNTIVDDDNKCLITNELLIDKFVTLECNHKFNYVPLYKDLINHKKKFNQLETKSGILKINEIRCPYCRNKQTTLLPYYEELNLEKVNGINYLNLNNSYVYIYSICEYQYLNPNFDETKEIDENNTCYCLCNNKFSTKLNENWEIYNDNKNYCYDHKKIMIQKYKKQKEVEKEYEQ